MVSTITVEIYLKDLMAIPCPRVDNSELLDGIDRVSNSLLDCINLAESTLRKKKSGIKHKEVNPQLQQMGGIFSGLDRTDDKLTSCIKLAEETLKQDDPEIENSKVTSSGTHSYYIPRRSPRRNPSCRCLSRSI